MLTYVEQLSRKILLGPLGWSHRVSQTICLVRVRWGALKRDVGSIRAFEETLEIFLNLLSKENLKFYKFKGLLQFFNEMYISLEFKVFENIIQEFETSCKKNSGINSMRKNFKLWCWSSFLGAQAYISSMVSDIILAWNKNLFLWLKTQRGWLRWKVFDQALIISAFPTLCSTHACVYTGYC